MKRVDSKMFHLSYTDIVRLVVSLIVLFLLLFLKDIFPKNPFVLKYFSGAYGFLWIVLFFIVFFMIEVSIARKRKTKAKISGRDS